jgi:SAM-dependent methyltransferase
MFAARGNDSIDGRPDKGFDRLVEEAMAQAFSGWNFSWLRGRWLEGKPYWDYRRIVNEKAGRVDSLLDMGTGGGEFLASLPKLPADSYATESYPPNIPVARNRLEPLGVRVVAFEDEQALPLPDASFELIINRHESYWIPEVVRLLKPGGTFLTQQVGDADCIELNEFLEAPLIDEPSDWSLSSERESLEGAGLQVIRTEETDFETLFFDIGAVVYYLKIIEWQFPDFSVERYRDRLLAMHHLIEEEGAFQCTSERFLIEARKVSG